MPQHFLLSKAARTLSLSKVARMSDAEAHDAFRMIRWAATGGNAVCPYCSCSIAYRLKVRPIWRCKACFKQFSVTSGTIFASRKLPIRTYLMCIAIFVNGAKGHSALQMSRDLDCQYKSAYVLCHKLREAMATEVADDTLEGEVEVDGAYFGGYVKPANRKENRVDRRKAENQTGKRRVVVVMRERNGVALPFVFKSESQAVPTIGQRVSPAATVYADDASSWDALHVRFLTKRIDHSVCYADGDTSTNMAESFFSRLRRAEIGTHHHFAGRYLSCYANEMAWRENNRRVSNGGQYLKVAGAALSAPISRQWAGYWQRQRHAI